MNKFSWLIKKNMRSVDNLRLWPENPRLNPEESHVTLADYAEDMTSDPSEKKDFFDLIKSISELGFVPADPMVVWQNEENKKFYVAEGNRRLVALKLLREPHKSPKSIRAFIRKHSSLIDLKSIEKIPVNIAPTFEEAEWYINQRNSTSSLQRRWSRIQQQRWVASLYEKYNGDIEKIMSVTRLDLSSLEEFIRTLKIREIITIEEVKSLLSVEEFEKANSHKFPITILERFFSSLEVREKWGIEFNGFEVVITSNLSSFYVAYAHLIKRIVNKENNDELKIDTRTITTHLHEILDSLPDVNLTPSEPIQVPIIEDSIEKPETEVEENSDETLPSAPKYEHLKNNPNRTRLILPIYFLNTDSTRLDGLFNEFKRIPIHTYPNSVAASLRVFLDIGVLNYIQREGLESIMAQHYRCDFREIALKRRIEYVKTHKLNGKVQTIATRLIDETHQFSLDVLNGFIHGQDTHYMSKQNLNNFWDFLFPLFQFLLDIREENV